MHQGTEDLYHSLPMLPRHRRHFGTIGEERRVRPRLLLRLILGVVIISIVWYLISTLFSFFDGSSGRKSAAILTVQSSSAVQVSLQGGEWQNSESNLKLYAGDGVQTRADGDATVTLFDGTRVRLDRSTEVIIEKSEKLTSATSSLMLTIKTGRAWVATPSSTAFTGSIVRSFETRNFLSTVPAGASALISATLVHVARAEGLGLTLHFAHLKTNVHDITIGEGQYFHMSDEEKAIIESGKDPYEFRDPVTVDLQKDAFFVSSYVQTSASAPATDGTVTTPADSVEPLTLTAPLDNAKVTSKTVTVSGRVSSLVATLTVNSSPVTIARDRSFSVDISLPKEKVVSITIEAQDSQGITIASIERKVQNAYEVSVPPVRIKSPVGSGETLRTSNKEVEITGEAPNNTAGIIVNDYRLQLFKSGSKTWSYLASVSNGNLKMGKNIFVINAVDLDGNKSPSRSITIELIEAVNSTSTGSSVTDSTPIKQNAPLTPGMLKVNSPSSGTSAETSDNELSITGTTSPDTASISVNGYALSLYTPGSTVWKYIASVNLETMKRGKNIYRVVARNQSGEILDVLEYTLTYRP